MNTLEDFSGQSRKDERLVYILLLVLAAAGTFILWNEEPGGGFQTRELPENGFPVTWGFPLFGELPKTRELQALHGRVQRRPVF
ncbi:MAG: hypothetical protein QOJ51_2195 [Acidobacteriaceae bacterium]|nr:hypothetical protein [Acidobacteriaceae bacterium]